MISGAGGGGGGGGAEKEGDSATGRGEVTIIGGSLAADRLRSS